MKRTTTTEEETETEERKKKDRTTTEKRKKQDERSGRLRLGRCMKRPRPDVENAEVPPDSPQKQAEIRADKSPHARAPLLPRVGRWPLGDLSRLGNPGHYFVPALERAAETWAAPHHGPVCRASERLGGARLLFSGFRLSTTVHSLDAGGDQFLRTLGAPGDDYTGPHHSEMRGLSALNDYEHHGVRYKAAGVRRGLLFSFLIFRGWWLFPGDAAGRVPVWRRRRVEFPRAPGMTQIGTILDSLQQHGEFYRYTEHVRSTTEMELRIVAFEHVVWRLSGCADGLLYNMAVGRLGTFEEMVLSTSCAVILELSRRDENCDSPSPVLQSCAHGLLLCLARQARIACMKSTGQTVPRGLAAPVVVATLPKDWQTFTFAQAAQRKICRVSVFYFREDSGFIDWWRTRRVTVLDALDHMFTAVS